jgi:hypothetical protein
MTGAKFGLEPELLITQHTALVYFSLDSTEKDLIDELAENVK